MTQARSKRGLVLMGDGINCEDETAYALSLVGIEPVKVHINDLIAHPEQLLNFGLLVLPGGFSFGDEVSSGKVLSIKLRYGLGEHLTTFITKGNLVLGICNGFQALVKLGLLPIEPNKKDLSLEPTVTLTHNQQGQFMNRWVWLTGIQQHPWLKGLERFMLPIRHGEGRLMLHPELSFESLEPHIALRYEEDVNGSVDRVAALCHPAGNVFGLMPHPEAFVRPQQHPAWTSLPSNSALEPVEPAGLRFFQNVAALI